VSRYGLVGGTSGQLLTYRGAVIVHDDRAELEWLVPNTRTVRLTDGDIGQPWIPLRQHPDLAAVRWPLRREDFTS
jgi:hypothetical protein